MNRCAQQGAAPHHRAIPLQFDPERRKHLLGVVPAFKGLGYRGAPFCIKTGQQNAGLDLGAGYRGLVINSLQIRISGYAQGWSSAVSGFNPGAHHGQWLYDAGHRALAD